MPRTRQSGELVTRTTTLGSHMSGIDVLVGNHPPLYREALSATVQMMRPDLLVRSVPHGELDQMVRELRPLLVICSMVTTAIADCSAAWIALYPEDKDEAIVSVGGKRRTIPHASILELLGILDEAGPLASS